MENQFSLLKQRRFLPLFITQFLGAFNDNVYKNAVIILIGFNTTLSIQSSNTLINLAGGLFILPFLLFSAPFGQLTDRLDKAKLIRAAKILEIIITMTAALALFLHSITLLLGNLFLLGAQATLFGPAKYSILPQHVKPHELVGANGLIESATFIAILVGTLFGGYLITLQQYGELTIVIAILTIAVLGYLSSRFIPSAASTDKTIRIDWNIVRATWQNMKLARQDRGVFLAMLGISWFWFYGTFMFYQVPNYTKLYLGGNAHVATTLIALFSIGIGIGSLLCEKLSRRVIEIALVPIGAVMLSLFTADLYHIQPVASHLHNQSVNNFFHSGKGIAIAINILLIGIAAGLFTVPLYALIQNRSKAAHRSRIIASVNILNALFMLLAAIYAIGLLYLGLTIPQLMLLTAVINACVTLYIFSVSIEFVVRLLVFLTINIMYRLKVRGIENLDIEGPAIYACNHVSFIDVMVMSSTSRRPIRFLMDHQLFSLPILNSISRLSRAIPIASEKENPEMKRQAFEETARALRAGEIVGIFPEGNITRDGTIGPMKRGLELILAENPVPIIPMALYGLWGSFFSRKQGKAMSKYSKRFWSRICLQIGTPIPAQEFSLERLQQDIETLYKKGKQVIEGSE